MKSSFRPAVLPDNRKLFFSILAAELLVAVVGLVVGNSLVIALPLIILAVFPGLPIFFHSVFFLFVRIEICDDRLVVFDYIGDKFVKLPRRQEILFDDIRYVYYLEKEINFLLNLRAKLKKYKVSHNETDYTSANLIDKYNVPAEKLNDFQKSSHKLLNDYTATAVFLKVEEICQKYNVPGQIQRRIEQGLKDDSNFNPDYVLDSLKAYLLSRDDIDSIRDEFANLNTEGLTPFLHTKVNVVKYKKTERMRHGTLATVRADIALVLSNTDGSRKLYLMHFHDLSESSLKQLIHEIGQKAHNIEYLITKSQRKRLFDR